jgi:uncharacterized protein
MQLNLERPDYTWFLRGADGSHALVNDRRLHDSFVIAPDSLIENWPVRDAATMAPADLEPLLALNPELIVLGTGAVQVFPPAPVMAACLSRGIGIEVMTNAAAARTFSVLAGESRQVVAGFIFDKPGVGAT